MSASKDKDKTFLLYGSYGYAGTLILNEALKRGVTPIIAGRNEAKCSAQAANDGLDFKVFDVNDTAQLDRALADPSFKVVLNCAGPFSKTAQPLIEACIRAGKHYVDITGEIEVFEMAHSYHDQAKEKQVIILCGAGFDVVPSDCLAQYLKKRLPTATHLTLGVSLDGMLSKGTAETVMGMFGKTNYVRQNGELVPVKFAHKTRPIPFHENDIKTGMSMAWGDTSSAFYSTGIPNIEVYFPSNPVFAWLVYLLSTKPAQWVVNSRMVKSVMKRFLVPKGGPSAHERRQAKSVLWGEARDEASGKTVSARLSMVEAYTLTALSAVTIVQRLMDTGNIKSQLSGYLTPSLAFGFEFILGLEGAQALLEDLTPTQVHPPASGTTTGEERAAQQSNKSKEKHQKTTTQQVTEGFTSQEIPLLG
eukprot:GILK01018073.1.p1 GENE.GILK01018073.1~~GILK01018073.1.p1  ORF type:complete len:419 (-),score=62.16 GILK01018073.1:96-1352(-)